MTDLRGMTNINLASAIKLLLEVVYCKTYVLFKQMRVCLIVASTIKLAVMLKNVGIFKVAFLRWNTKQNPWLGAFYNPFYPRFWV